MAQARAGRPRRRPHLGSEVGSAIGMAETSSGPGPVKQASAPEIDTGLQIPAEEMRRLGYWVVDQVVDHFAHGAQGPVTKRGDAEALWSSLGGPVPQEPGDPEAAMRLLTEVAFGHMQHGDHPRFSLACRAPRRSQLSWVNGWARGSTPWQRPGAAARDPQRLNWSYWPGFVMRSACRPRRKVCSSAAARSPAPPRSPQPELTWDRASRT